jgi:RES domain-containing protein
VNLWRLCRRPYADLSGEGGRLYAGRWHDTGRPIIYTATEPALAVLEVRANLDLPFALLPDDYVLMRLEAAAMHPEHIPSLPPNPRDFGNAWLTSRRSALLQVPSVVVPQASNMLINPLHPDAAHLSIADIIPFAFDARLWS